MHYVYTVYKRVLDTLLHTSRRDTTPDGSYYYTKRTVLYILYHVV